jgi:hypothetical protein
MTQDVTGTPQDPDAMWWVPGIRASQATALVVPLGLPYHQAVQDKLVGLLVEAGEEEARSIIGMYLEQEEAQVLDAEFPEGWAAQIMMTGDVSLMVLDGDPDVAQAADEETREIALECQSDLTLGEFLGAAPTGGGSMD